MADKPHAQAVNQTSDIAGRLTSRMDRFQRALSPWVQRGLAESGQTPAPTGRTGPALTVAQTHSLVNRVQRLPEQSTVWRPNVGAIDPLLTDRFARKITDRFVETGSRYQIQRQAHEPAESNTLPLAGLQPEETSEPDTSFVEALPFSVEEVRRALEKGSPAVRPDPGQSSAQAPVQRTPAPSSQRDRQFPFSLDEVRAALEKKSDGQATPPAQRQTGEAPPVTPARPGPSRMRRFAKIEEITPGGEPAEVTPPEPPAFPGASSSASETETEAARTEEPAVPHPDRDTASSAPPAQGETPSKPGAPAEPEPSEAIESQTGPPEAPSIPSPPEGELPLRRPESGGPGQSAGEQPPTVEAEIRRAEEASPVAQPKRDDAPAGQKPEPDVKPEPSPSAASDLSARRAGSEPEPPPAETTGGQRPATEEEPGGESPPPTGQARQDESAPELKPVVRPDLGRSSEEALSLRRPESGEGEGTTDVSAPTAEAEIRRAEGAPPVIQSKRDDAPAGQEPKSEIKPQPSAPAVSDQPVRRAEPDAARPSEAARETAPSGGDEPIEAEAVETEAKTSGPVVQAKTDAVELESSPVVQPELDQTAEPDLPLRRPESVEGSGAEPGPVEQAKGPGSVVQARTDDEASEPGPVVQPDLEQEAKQQVPGRRPEPGEGQTPEAPAAGSPESGEGPGSESVGRPAVETKPAAQVEGSPPTGQARSEAGEQESRPVVQPGVDRAAESELPLRASEPVEAPRTVEPDEGPVEQADLSSVAQTQVEESEPKPVVQSDLDEATQPELPLRGPESGQGGSPEPAPEPDSGPVDGEGAEPEPAEQAGAPPSGGQTRRDAGEAEPRPVVQPKPDQAAEPQMPVRRPEPVEGRSSATDDDGRSESGEAPVTETKPVAWPESPPSVRQASEGEAGPKPVVQPKLDQAAEPQMPGRRPESGEARTPDPGERGHPESAGEPGPEAVAEQTPDRGQGQRLESVERRPSLELPGPVDEPSRPPRPVGQAKREHLSESGPALTLRRPEPAEEGVEPDSATVLDQDVLARTKSGSDLLVTRPLGSIQRVLDQVSRPEKTAVLPQARGKTGFSEEGSGAAAEEATPLPVRTAFSDFRREGALPLAAPPRPAERVSAGTATGLTPSGPASTAALQRQEVETMPAAQPVEPAAAPQPSGVIQRAEADELAPTAPETEERKPDLDKLARQILPLIKRLLAVERDRRPFR